MIKIPLLVNCFIFLSSIRVRKRAKRKKKHNDIFKNTQFKTSILKNMFISFASIYKSTNIYTHVCTWYRIK